MTREITELNPEVAILDDSMKELLDGFVTGTKYPEIGIGDYSSSKQAIEDWYTGDGVSYVVFQLDGENNRKDVISYFTLETSALPYLYKNHEEDVEVLCSISAIKIKMFGVDIRYQDKFYKDKLVAALIFETIISIISKQSLSVAGVKAIYLYTTEDAKKFYLKNNMRAAEGYMLSFADQDKELDEGNNTNLMYTFIREVKTGMEAEKG